MRKFYKALQFFSTAVYKLIVTGILIAIYNTASAQCPSNIDFEQGDFRGWQCWVGAHYIMGTGRDTIDFGITPVAPVAGRHTMLTSFPGNGRDPYGNFPQNCPNGSGHSIKLGNTTGGAQAEGVSYTFTIPAGKDKFSLIYNYAVVFQDPGHLPQEQPALQIEVKNLTDNIAYGCSSFSFISTSGLPGFFQSKNPNGPTPVWCKNWSAASINLDGNAGKTIQLFFKTADCTFYAHFGYAYIDVNAECSSSFVGATFCPDDTLVNVIAPFGYQNYKWFNNNFTQLLGTSQTLTLNPPPLVGDSVFVELTPYSGYGCLDTLSAKLWDTLTVNANAGVDRETCDNNLVQLGSPPVPGRVYKWFPATGLSDPNISNPLASPSASTTYTLQVTNAGGGCATTDNVDVTVDILSDSIQLIGAASYCTRTGQSASLKVLPHDSIQWFKDNIAIPGANQTEINITQTGAYYAMLFSSTGCNRTTAVKQINIWETPVAAITLNQAQQCFAGNQFVFTSTINNTTGILQYLWNLGDGTTANTRTVTHSYTTAGNFKVKLLETAPGGCKDSTEYTVTVYPSPNAGFTINAAAQCFKNNQFVFINKSTISAGTIQYSWDLGDGTLLASPDVTHSYLIPGTYNVKLSTSAVSGCRDDSLFVVIVNPSPVAGFGINNNPQCFPGHQFVFTNSSTIFSGSMQYIWSMGDGSLKTSADVNYGYAKAGNYTVKMYVDAAGGCKDSTFLDVIVHPTPSADFTVLPVCINLQVPVYNRTFNNTASTINYFWDFGNGHLDNTKNPVYNYPLAGTYSVKLSVSTAQCPVSVNTKTVDITIDAPARGIVYPDKDAAFNFPEPLQARQIGNSVTWTPPINLSNRFSYTPTFKGLAPQLYTIQLKTATGCLTVDTQFVKTHKKIEIYVPAGFTPGGDGINERLRPVLIGFSKVNYFKIYNRWGKLLFSMNSDQPGWDGKVNGSPVDMQTVVWMIEAVDVDGKVHNRQGSAVVIR